jgi:hypothetical protein
MASRTAGGKVDGAQQHQGPGFGVDAPDGAAGGGEGGDALFEGDGGHVLGQERAGQAGAEGIEARHALGGGLCGAARRALRRHAVGQCDGAAEAGSGALRQR